MTNLRCTRRPQSSRNLTVDTVYENAVLYTQGMAPTEDFSEAYYVFLINNNGTNTRYRASLFEVANPVPVIPVVPVNIDLENAQLEVDFIDSEGNVNNGLKEESYKIRVKARIGGRVIHLVTPNQYFSVMDTENSFSCEIRLIGNIGRAVNTLTETSIRTNIEAYEVEHSTEIAPITITYPEDICNRVAQAIINQIKEGAIEAAFLLMSLVRDSHAYELFGGKFDTESEGVTNPNSGNQIMIGVIHVN